MTTYTPTRPRPMPRSRPAPRRARPRQAPRPKPRTVPMDPRVRARRIAVTREAGRRRLHRLMFVLGLFGLAGLVAGAVVSPLLDVNQVRVVGITGPHADEVRVATGVEPGEALMLVDTGAATARVEELVWVDDVNIVRELPGTLRVEVTPRFPVGYRTIDTGEIELIDGRGITLMTAPTAPPGLPQLEAGDDAVRLAARVAGALSDTLVPLVARVAVADGHAFLWLTSGIEVRFGEASGLVAKARATEALLAALGGTPVTYINVEVPSAPVTG